MFYKLKISYITWPEKALSPKGKVERNEMRNTADGNLLTKAFYRIVYF